MPRLMVEEGTEVVREHGHVIIDALVLVSVLDQVTADMQPFIQKAGAPTGRTASGARRRSTIH